jgi:hypothetical protein
MAKPKSPCALVCSGFPESWFSLGQRVLARGGNFALLNRVPGEIEVMLRREVRLAVSGEQVAPRLPAADAAP